jgi:AraC family transcriptional activator of pobA
VLQFDTTASQASRLHALFQALLAEFLLPDSAGSPVPVWLARSLVWHLSKASAQVQQGQDLRAYQHQALFTRFLLLVEQHFLEHWPLDCYASQLGLSTPRLNRLVSAEPGISALELVHERLTREACRRLNYIAAPVSRLAVELGFEDPAYFSRFVRRRTGQSPHSFCVA